VLTAAPADALPLPLTASAFWAALRCELLMPFALDPPDELAELPEELVDEELGAAAVTVPEGS
jgi:hypothetical protein